MNPHPTKSKPCKIGRKHTGAPSEKVKQKRRNHAASQQKQANLRFRKWKAKVREFWMGEREDFPAVE